MGAEAIAGAAGDMATAAGAAAGSIALPALVIGGTAAASYGAGMVLNDGIDALIRQSTNGKEQNLGGLIYDWVHGGGDQAQQKARAKVVANTMNAAAELQKNNPEYQAKTAELQKLASQGKTAANDPEAARLTRDTLKMIHEQAGKMGGDS
jgi:hypothetical protein